MATEIKVYFTGFDANAYKVGTEQSYLTISDAVAHISSLVGDFWVKYVAEGVEVYGIDNAHLANIKPAYPTPGNVLGMKRFVRNIKNIQSPFTQTAQMYDDDIQATQESEGIK